MKRKAKLVIKHTPWKSTQQLLLRARNVKWLLVKMNIDVSIG